MKKIAGHRLSIIFLLIGLLWAVPSKAASVAVFPVDDLSTHHNSISDNVTRFLGNEIEKKGVNVIPEQDVLKFMTQFGVRQLGYLSSAMIMQTRSSLKADLILLASVCQRQVKPASLGMTLSLIRTSDGMTIWSSNCGLSEADEQRFLGIDAPRSVGELMPIMARDIFADWPEDLDSSAGRKKAALQTAKVRENSYIQVDSVFFTPKFVRPGQDVRCTVRFQDDKVLTREAKVFIKVGNQVHLASSDDGVYYSASWRGLNRKSGKNVQVAMNDPDSKIFNEVWNGSFRDADYPVTLVLDWPSGKHEESYLGSYVVDSRPPAFNIKLGGRKIGKLAAFRKRISFSVKLKRSEPVSKWAMAIVDKDSKVILRDRGSGMTPQQFYWSGQTSRNIRADNGVYYICIKLWDRAGNTSQASKKVLLLPATTGIDVSLKAKDKAVIASLKAKDQVPVLSWRMELWSQENQLLYTFRGDSLPAKVKLPWRPAKVDKEKIECILAVRDTMGSKSIHSIKDFLANIVSEKQDKPMDKSDEGLSDWHADF